VADEARKAQAKDELFAKYNSRGMQQGYDLQGEYFLRTVALLDQLDGEWTEAWLTFVYDYMYGRGILDDKTRTLIVIGECIAGGHFEQLPNHMRTAIKMGAEPREVLEVALHSAIYCGMPSMRKAVAVFRQLMEEMDLMQFEEVPFTYVADS
jgi:alkylhydroperoxidase/carboxymuconolactone decarboxylase family protein YurZ